jgi:acyl-CoA reductase-like NAD-dependent aldehyde dehydrogenase
MALRHPLFLASRAHDTRRFIEVTDKFTGEIVARVASADRTVIDAAIGAAARAAAPMRKLAAYERREVLEHCVRRFRERAEPLAHVMCVEGGKPIGDARIEVGRLIETFRTAADESVRMLGEVIPLDLSARTRHYSGQWKRVPIGPCSFITPFNFPLNLAAHKIAPALAVGCPFVLKPASATPLSALAIGEVLAECDLPEGAFSILPCSRADADLLATDDRLKLLSFTGSPDAGWELKAKAGKKRVTLELGGNAAVVLDEDTDIEDAVARIIAGKFAQSGQSCIAVQRILIHRRIYDATVERLVAATRALRCGNPKDETVTIGPLISEADAQRLESWIASAVTQGARLLCGGARRGAVLEPALLENVPPACDLWRREAFGPVAAVAAFDDFDGALAQVNDGPYGLQAGVFTRDIRKIQRAWQELDVGAVIIGDVPAWRADHMPYGGVKDSGLGREGVRFAMEDMTEMRLLVVRNPGT